MMSENFYYVCLFVVIFFGVIFGVALGGSYCDLISFKAEAAAIEAGLKVLSPIEAEDTVAQAVELNRQLAVIQRWNNVTFFGLFIHNAWVKVNPIDMRAKREAE